jgi:DNA replication initiation complex subunit (GINS family)
MEPNPNAADLAAAEAAAKAEADQKAAEEAAAAEAAKKKANGVKVRILVDHPHDGGVLRCNTVATLDKATAAALVKGGIADDSAAAVKAALEQNAE